MSETTVLEALPRDVIGKANRRLKAAGQIPAVLYGPIREPLVIAIDRHDFEYMMQHHATGATIVKLKVEGEGKPFDAIIKDVQVSPVKGTVLHVDFLAIRLDEVIQATAPVHFVGDAPGVKEGGVLLQDLREFTVEALPMSLPENIEVDVSGLELGDSLTVGDIPAPEGVAILDEPETVVCSVSLPTIEVEEETEEGAEMVEPTLVGEDEAAEDESAG